MEDEASGGEDSVEPAPSGALFCRWCAESWHEYESMGGVCRLLGLTPKEFRDDGTAELSATFPDSLCNPLGSVHGGVIAMLLDEAGGLAVCCLVGFRNLRGTSGLDISFVSRARPGPVLAKANVVRRDGSDVEVDVKVVQADRLIARAQGLYRVNASGDTAAAGARGGDE